MGAFGGSGANLLSDFVDSTGVSNGDSCTVDGKSFSSFSYSPDGFSGSIAGIPAVPATAVGVHPATTRDGPGLEFNGAWVNNNTAAVAADATTTFTVTDTDGTSIIDAFLLISGLSGNGALDSNVVDSETVTFLDATTRVFEVTGASPSAHTSFAGVTSLVVRDDLTVQPGADVSIVDKEFSQTVPEPASLAIFAVSLFGMGAIRRRFRR